jgi:hypothetical protein
MSGGDRLVPSAHINVTRVDRERAHARRRRRLFTAHLSTAVLLVTVVGVAITGGSARSAAIAVPAVPAGQASAVTSLVTSVPQAALDGAAASAVTAPTRLSGPPLVANGTPQVLYVGAEFCPYCAATRWPLVIALSKFGSFTGLGVTHSSTSDVYPGTPTLSFHGATYSSPYLSLDAKELYTNVSNGSGYTTLDTLTPAEQAIFDDKTINPQGGFPFVDLGGSYVAGTPFDPGLLKGMTAEQIAQAAHDGTGPAGAAIDTSANEITAALCTLTGGKPTAVCSSAGVAAAKGKLNG